MSIVKIDMITMKNALYITYNYLYTCLSPFLLIRVSLWLMTILSIWIVVEEGMAIRHTQTGRKSSEMASKMTNNEKIT